MRHAAAHDDQNFEFLRSLKFRSYGFAPDKMAGQLHDEAFRIVDCTRCANCCKTMDILLTAADMRRIARHLGMTPSDFVAAYLEPEARDDDSHKYKYRVRSKPCAFLAQDGRCTIYDVRPTVCREYPHTNKKGFASRTHLHAHNALSCPIVFWIVEQMKLLACCLSLLTAWALLSTQPASAAVVGDCRLVMDGSSDPPGDRIACSVGLLPDDHPARLELRAFVLPNPTGKQPADDQPAAVKASGRHNRGADGELLVVADVSDKPESETSLIVPYADLSLPIGQYRIGYVVSLRVKQRVVWTQALPATLLRVTAAARDHVRPQVVGPEASMASRSSKAYVAGRSLDKRRSCSSTSNWPGRPRWRPSRPWCRADSNDRPSKTRPPKIPSR